MGDYSPLFLPGKAITMTASAAVTGGQAVEVTGNMQVGPGAAASAKIIGHAGYDAPSGGEVTVYGRGTVHEAPASGTITAGASVVAAATGKVAAAAGSEPVLGVALTAAASGRVLYMEF
ncbi:capsid cement protein [Micromonospora sp. NPDC006766]|uniref:capsid cement protein n=1 Tax=Micromonospora sp. NPDC006766 TaxID=3154778 RepID=UPI00340479A5